jgi:hypothetical protein
MKNHFLITILLYALPNLIFGQVQVTSDLNIRNPEILIIRNTRLSYKEIAGNPYLTDSFVVSKIFMKNKQIVEMKLRYDIYADEIEIWNKSQIYYLVKAGFDSIIMNNLKIVYLDFKAKSKLTYTYFVTIVEDKYSLLQRKRVEFCEEDKASPYSEIRPARFEVKRDVYYMKDGSNPAVEIENKSDFKKEFPSLYKKAESLIKKQSINFSKQNDLIILTKFLNSD